MLIYTAVFAPDLLRSFCTRTLSCFAAACTVSVKFHILQYCTLYSTAFCARTVSCFVDAGSVSVKLY